VTFLNALLRGEKPFIISSAKKIRLLIESLKGGGRSKKGNPNTEKIPGNTKKPGETRENPLAKKNPL